MSRNNIVRCRFEFSIVFCLMNDGAVAKLWYKITKNFIKFHTRVEKRKARKRNRVYGMLKGLQFYINSAVVYLNHHFLSDVIAWCTVCGIH